MNKVSTLISVPAQEIAPLPVEVQRGLDTVQFWIQTIGGSIAVIGLMLLAMGLFFAHRNGQGPEFMGKVGWWAVGAMMLGLAGVIAPIFVGI
ncbi:hypothetical protein V6S67_19690 [Arthrobacter sp. Soc17.1.1.1]|uniref:hypothetical protein n=1 Tax=Arthrobacter sp. Soc17.1.1.1 TaxID=3121277 RepID=UPI002FE44FF3